MNKWSDINPAPMKPVEEKKEEFDWLKEVESIKRECRIKTKVPEVVYPDLNRRYKYSNLTESWDSRKR